MPSSVHTAAAAEPLRLAVGLRSIGAREALGDAELRTGFAEGARSEGATVVGEHAFDANAQAAVVRHRVAQELFGAVAALISVHVAIADPGVIIDGHE